MLFEIATITAPPERLEAATAGIDAWMANTEARGERLDGRRAGTGALRRLVVLRRVAGPRDMTVERRRG